MIHTNFALHRPVTTVMIFAAVATIGALAAKLLPLISSAIKISVIQVRMRILVATPLCQT